MSFSTCLFDVRLIQLVLDNCTTTIANSSFSYLLLRIFYYVDVRYHELAIPRYVMAKYDDITSRMRDKKEANNIRISQ